MASFGAVVNREVTPADLANVIPEGEYLLIVSKSEKKASKSGNGAYINLELQVVEGQHERHHLWDMIQVENNGPNAEKCLNIAKARILEYSAAVGYGSCVTDSAQLHDIPFIGKVTVYTEKYQGEDVLKNKVTKLRPRGGATPMTNGAVPGAPWAGVQGSNPAATTPAKTSAAPWN